MSNQQKTQPKPDGFIKNPDLLKETEQVKDLLGFGKIIKGFRNYLNNIKGNAIVGLIGPFGVGKSTMLHQLQEEDEEKHEKNIKWVKFDAWKYPDKKDLWEGFIFDFIRASNNKKLKLITTFQLLYLAITVLGISVLISIVKGSFDLIPLFTEIINNFRHGSILSRILYSVIYFITGFVVGRFGRYLVEEWKSDPKIIQLAFKALISTLHINNAKRVDDYHKILENHINTDPNLKNIETIYVVIEDVDRSQDSGIFFLETLSYFLKKYKLNKQIIVIAPINTNYLSRHNPNHDKDEEVYLKSLDYTFNFDTSDIDFTDFIQEIFDLEQIDTNTELVIDHLQYLFRDVAINDNHGKMSIRKLKLLIREANKLYQSVFITKKDGKEIEEESKKYVDIRIWLAFYFAKHTYNIKLNKSILSGFKSKTHYEGKKLDRLEISWMYKLLLKVSSSIYEDKLTYSFNSNLDIRMYSGVEHKAPYFVRDIEGETYYSLTNLYINKLNIY